MFKAAGRQEVGMVSITTVQGFSVHFRGAGFRVQGSGFRV